MKWFLLQKHLLGPHYLDNFTLTIATNKYFTRKLNYYLIETYTVKQMLAVNSGF